MRLLLRYDPEVKHDFAASASVRVRGVLQLQNNTSVTASGSLTLTDPRDDHNMDGFCWVGKTKIAVSGIAPGAMLEVPVAALVTRTGVYNLSNFIVDIKGEGVDLDVGKPEPSLVAVLAAQ